MESYLACRRLVATTNSPRFGSYASQLMRSEESKKLKLHETLKKIEEELEAMRTDTECAMAVLSGNIDKMSALDKQIQELRKLYELNDVSRAAKGGESQPSTSRTSFLDNPLRSTDNNSGISTAESISKRINDSAAVGEPSPKKPNTNATDESVPAVSQFRKASGKETGVGNKGALGGLFTPRYYSRLSSNKNQRDKDEMNIRLFNMAKTMVNMETSNDLNIPDTTTGSRMSSDEPMIAVSNKETSGMEFVLELDVRIRPNSHHKDTDELALHFDVGKPNGNQEFSNELLNLYDSTGSWTPSDKPSSNKADKQTSGRDIVLLPDICTSSNSEHEGTNDIIVVHSNVRKTSRRRASSNELVILDDSTGSGTSSDEPMITSTVRTDEQASEEDIVLLSDVCTSCNSDDKDDLTIVHCNVSKSTGNQEPSDELVILDNSTRDETSSDELVILDNSTGGRTSSNELVILDNSTGSKTTSDERKAVKKRPEISPQEYAPPEVLRAAGITKGILSTIELLSFLYLSQNIDCPVDLAKVSFTPDVNLLYFQLCSLKFNLKKICETIEIKSQNLIEFEEKLDVLIALFKSRIK